jgi:hypothetical protein
MELVESLIDIKNIFKKKTTRSNSKSKETKKTALEPNPVDENYDALKCTINPLDQKHKDWKMIETYIKNTSHGRNLKLKEIFEIERQGEDKIYNPKKLGN